MNRCEIFEMACFHMKKLIEERNSLQLALVLERANCNSRIQIG